MAGKRGPAKYPSGARALRSAVESAAGWDKAILMARLRIVECKQAITVFEDLRAQGMPFPEPEQREAGLSRMLYHLPETVYESIESVDQPGMKLIDIFPDGIYFIVNDRTDEIEGVFKALPQDRPAKVGSDSGPVRG